MKSRIAALIIGIVLGSTATAIAGVSYYWEERGTTYRCQGNLGGVICKETNWSGSKYSVYLIAGQVSVNYGKSLIFACDRPKRPAGNCAYYGP